MIIVKHTLVLLWAYFNFDVNNYNYKNILKMAGMFGKGTFTKCSHNIKISIWIDENRNTESQMKQSQNTVVQALHPRSSRMNTVVNYLLATASPVLQAIYSPLHQYYNSAVSAIHQYLRKPAQIVASQVATPQIHKYPQKYPQIVAFLILPNIFPKYSFLVLPKIFTSRVLHITIKGHDPYCNLFYFHSLVSFGRLRQG